MNVLNKLKNNNGITLVELLVVLALLGIVIGVASNFFLYGIKVFNKGTTESAIQQDVNQAAFYITNKLRNVKEISISNEYGYSDLNVQGRYPKINNIEYKIVHVGGTNYNIEFEITRESHSVKSKIILNNVKSASAGSGSNVWYLETTPTVPNAQLSSLSVSSGILTPTFSSTTNSYAVSLPYGTTNVPTVNAVGKDGASVAITDALSLPGSTVVNVTSSDGTKNSIYTVEFSPLPPPPVVATEAVTSNRVVTHDGGSGGSRNWTVTVDVHIKLSDGSSYSHGVTSKTVKQKDAPTIGSLSSVVTGTTSTGTTYTFTVYY